jgi:very-short-patch-repair endonuclease
MSNNEKENSQNGSPPSEWCPQDGVGKNAPVLTTIDAIPIYRKPSPYLPAEKNLRNRARALRKMGNLPEIVFWLQVHKGKFYNIDFDRQRIIGHYIVDFYVKGLMLVVEIDGSSHNEKQEYDDRRENYLRNLGLLVWKVSATEVMMDVERVMENLKQYIIDKYS